jgi:hypothetical protein
MSTSTNDCPGHPAEDFPNPDPHAGIGEIRYCDGSCQRGSCEACGAPCGGRWCPACRIGIAPPETSSKRSR